MKYIFLAAYTLFFISGVTFSQTRINSLDISGNNYFTGSEIRNMMVSKKDAVFKDEQFNLDLKTIRDKYKSSGFLYIKFDKDEVIFNDDSSMVDINLQINEGKKVVIGKIGLAGNKVLPTQTILGLFSTKTGDILNENTLNNDINELLKLYETKELPFAKVKINDISVYKENGNDKLRLDIGITENSKIKIDQVKITGNESTQDYVILRELKIDKSKYLTSSSLQKMKERLDRLNIFDYVDDPKIYSLKNKDESRLLINVKEGNTNTFDGVLGYNPPQVNEQSGYLTGLVNVSFRNLFGTGRKLQAKYQQEVRETQELEFVYFEPYFFNFPLNINFGFLQRIQDSTYTKRNLDLKGDFLFSDNFTISLVGNFNRIIPSDQSDSSYVIADSRILSSGVELKYDTRDNIYIPTKGFLYSSIYTFGEKKIYNLPELQNLGYNESYSIQKYFVNLDFYISFLKRQTNLLKLFGGEVRSDRLEDGDYFRIGGNNFIRGYRSEQFLASKLAGGNLELRYSISRKGFLLGFYDAGYYSRPADVLNNFPEQKGFIYGYGLGIRLETTLGIIGVSYALGKDAGLLDGIINFGFINDF